MRYIIEMILQCVAYQKCWATEVCSIIDFGEVEFISSDSYVSPEIVNEWVDNSIRAYTVLNGEQVAAFVTLSNRELPEQWISNKVSCEVCHLVVHPNLRRRGIGTTIIEKLLSEAREIGFKKVFGRVNPKNHIGLSFIKSLPFREVVQNYAWSNTKSRFRWFVSEIDKYG